MGLARSCVLLEVLDNKVVALRDGDCGCEIDSQIMFLRTLQHGLSLMLNVDVHALIVGEQGIDKVIVASAQCVPQRRALVLRGGEIGVQLGVLGQRNNERVT